MELAYGFWGSGCRFTESYGYFNGLLWVISKAFKGFNGFLGPEVPVKLRDKLCFPSIVWLGSNIIRPRGKRLKPSVKKLKKEKTLHTNF